MVKVYIMESERGWGQRVDETLEFSDQEAAQKYCDDYNRKYNTADTVPDWYMYARLA